MTTLRELGYGRNRLQEIIADETDTVCRILTETEGQATDLHPILK